jgi:predicted NBD/HSP70 family sugar kinase
MSPIGSKLPVAGLDIGGSKIQAVLVDEGGRVIGSGRTDTDAGPDGVVGSVSRVLEELLASGDAAPGGLAAVGVGVPGLVDPRLGVVAHAVNLGLDAAGLALGSHLEQRLGVPVVVENDVNAAAIGAVDLLGASGRDLAYLSIGTGLAAGLVLDGRLRRGHGGAAGEIGHIPVDPAGEVCGCGQRGCLETLASGSALRRQWPALDGSSVASSLFAAAAAGDERAIAIRDRFAGHLALAVRLLVLAVDVDVVVLGGGVAEVGAPLADAVVRALAEQASASTFLAALDLPSRVVLTSPTEPVAAVGAALLGRSEAVGRTARVQA